MAGYSRATRVKSLNGEHPQAKRVTYACLCEFNQLFGYAFSDRLFVIGQTQGVQDVMESFTEGSYFFGIEGALSFQQPIDWHDLSAVL
jgi:hypothetical protein